MGEIVNIILFDGECNLCNHSVQFILKHDHAKKFLFGSMQGKTGQEILRKHQLSADNFHSFMLLEGDQLFTRSTGALRVLKLLGGFWRIFYVFIWVPRIVRDGIYDLIAKNRYRWFGKRSECWVPNASLQSRFLP